MTPPGATDSRSLRLAAERGAAAWMTYGIVEYAYATLVPWISQPDYRFTLWHWGFGAVLFLTYASIGGAAALAAELVWRALTTMGLFRRGEHELDWTSLGSLSIIVAFAGNLLLRFGGQPVVLGLVALCAGLALVVVAALRVAIPQSISLFTRPAAVSIALLGMSSLALIGLEGYAPAVRIGTALAVVLVELALCLCLAKVLARVSSLPGVHAKQWRAPLVRQTALAAGALVVSSLMVHASPRLSATSAKPATRHGPNIVLIVMDTVRADHLSVYGYGRRTTPELEQFAREATLYKRAFSAGDMTLSAQASMFTGAYAYQNGAHYNDSGLPQALRRDMPTTAETLAAHGYKTLALVANHVFFRNWGLDRGFAYSDSRAPSEFVALHALDGSKFFLRQGIHKVLASFAPTQMRERHYRKAEEITTEASTLLSDLRAGQSSPFFMFVNYMDAHWPYMPPPPFDRTFPGKIDGFTSNEYNTLLIDVMQARRRTVTARERDHLVSQDRKSVV